MIGFIVCSCQDVSEDWLVSYALYKRDAVQFYDRYPSEYIGLRKESEFTTLYADSMCVIEDARASYNVYGTDLLPNKTSSNNIPAIDFRTSPGVNIRENIVLKVLMKNSYPGGEAYSCKSFIPNHLFGAQSARPYNWTYEELKAKGY